MAETQILATIIIKHLFGQTNCLRSRVENLFFLRILSIWPTFWCFLFPNSTFFDFLQNSLSDYFGSNVSSIIQWFYIFQLYQIQDLFWKLFSFLFFFQNLDFHFSPNKVRIS